MRTVWIYVDTNKEVGDRDHLKVFSNPDAAEEWFKENDPEGVAFGYEVIDRHKSAGAFGLSGLARKVQLFAVRSATFTVFPAFEADRR